MSDATSKQTTIPDAPAGHASTPQRQAETSTCCGGPAPAGADACCARDAEVKSTGGTGCGCGSAPEAPPAKKTGCCG